MADLIISRCTLRIVRRRGWSWGPEPQLLLKAAVAALPLLIARRLGDLFTDVDDAEITEPVRLSIPIKLSELLEFAAEAGGSISESGVVSSGVVDQRITAAVTRALGKDEVVSKREERQLSKISQPESDLDERQHEKTRRHHVLHLLLDWQQQGELEIHLASFSERELKAWSHALLAAVFELIVTSTVETPAAISPSLGQLKERLQATAPDQIAVIRLHMIALLEIGEQLQRKTPNAAKVRALLAELFDRFGLSLHLPPAVNLREGGAPESPRDSTQASELFLLTEPATIALVREKKIERIAQAEFHVRSVLPFLLLGPLARIGYLDALAATLEAAGLLSEAHIFATALAFKVLTPPARGWRRESEDLAVAAAFAGVDVPAAGQELSELARRLSGRLTPLDSLVSYTLIKGHRPNCPILLHRTQEESEPQGLVLAEIEGLFPICWAPDLQSLSTTLKYFSETHLLIQQATVKSDTLQELHESGFRFITDAPPVRGESWREVRRTPRERWYTNDTVERESVLVRMAEELASAAEETESVWRALKIDRPAMPTARDSELERSLSLAASLALGTISWTLWRDRETVTPVLALERFGNLAGKVRFTSNAVEVRLPLGRRRNDLYEHALLADVENVPWMNGRRVEFSGG